MRARSKRILQMRPGRKVLDKGWLGGKEGGRNRIKMSKGEGRYSAKEKRRSLSFSIKGGKGDKARAWRRGMMFPFS